MVAQDRFDCILSSVDFVYFIVLGIMRMCNSFLLVWIVGLRPIEDFTIEMPSVWQLTDYLKYLFDGQGYALSNSHVSVCSCDI